MADKPLFLFVGAYSNEADAKADDDVVKQLYKEKIIGTYDAAIVTKEPGLPFRSFSTWNFHTYQANWAAQKAAGFRPVSISSYL